jgi:hypothetical protein
MIGPAIAVPTGDGFVTGKQTEANRDCDTPLARTQVSGLTKNADL